jgi:hypothetical protein
MKGYSLSDIEGMVTGGKTQEQLLTGEYLTELDPKTGIVPNAEVEGGEYIKFPEGDTQKVAGPDHEQGGVPVNIPDETRILSKSVNLTKQQAEKLTEFFNIDLTTKDTYASALDKFTKKSGLKKINEEHEEVLKGLRKQLDNQKIDAKTKRINEAYISKKIYDLEKDKQPLEQAREKMFDVLFEMQEKTKADQGDEEAMFRYGGIQKSNFENVARKLGMSPEEAAMLLRQKRAMQTFEKGGLMQYPDGGIFVTEGTKVNTFGSLSPEVKTKLVDWYEKHNPDVAKQLKDKKLETFVPPQAILQAATSGSTLKNVGQHYDKKSLLKAPTAGDVTSDMVQYFALKEFYESQPENKGKTFTNITKDELTALQNRYATDFEKRAGVKYYSGKQGKDVVSDGIFGNVTASYMRQNVTLPATKAGVIDVDKLWGLSDDDLAKQLEGTGVTPQQLAEFKSSAVKYVTLDPNAPAPTVTPPPAAGDKTPPPTDPLVTGTPIVDKVGQRPGTDYPRLFFTPDQSALPPTAPEAHLKANIRLERIDPVRVGIEQTLQETANQRNFVTDQIGSMPESQRVAVLANLLATTQGTINQAAQQANMTNAQNQSQAELFNIQQSGQEQMLEAQNSLDFERRQFTAKAKADESLRNFYDYNRKVNVNNFENMQRLNLLDSLFPDFDLDFFGAGVNYNPKSEWAPTVNMAPQNNSTPMTKEEIQLERERARLATEQTKRQAAELKLQEEATRLGMLPGVRTGLFAPTR